MDQLGPPGCIQVAGEEATAGLPGGAQGCGWLCGFWGAQRLLLSCEERTDAAWMQPPLRRDPTAGTPQRFSQSGVTLGLPPSPEPAKGHPRVPRCKAILKQRQSPESSPRASSWGNVTLGRPVPSGVAGPSESCEYLWFSCRANHPRPLRGPQCQGISARHRNSYHPCPAGQPQSRPLEDHPPATCGSRKVPSRMSRCQDSTQLG